MLKRNPSSDYTHSLGFPLVSCIWLVRRVRRVRLAARRTARGPRRIRCVVGRVRATARRRRRRRGGARDGHGGRDSPRRGDVRLRELDHRGGRRCRLHGHHARRGRRRNGLRAFGHGYRARDRCYEGHDVVSDRPCDMKREAAYRRWRCTRVRGMRVRSVWRACCSNGVLWCAIWTAGQGYIPVRVGVADASGGDWLAAGGAWGAPASGHGGIRE